MDVLQTKYIIFEPYRYNLKTLRRRKPRYSEQMLRIRIPDTWSSTFFEPWIRIREPVPEWIKTGSGIRDKHPGSKFWELRNNSQFSVANLDPAPFFTSGSGMEKILNRDKHSGSATYGENNAPVPDAWKFRPGSPRIQAGQQTLAPPPAAYSGPPWYSSARNKLIR
jgi:hypothetical protein